MNIKNIAVLKKVHYYLMSIFYTNVSVTRKEIHAQDTWPGWR